MEKQALSIPEFCAAHGLSRSFYFILRKDGLGPREMRVGGRVLISREAAADWRRDREETERAA
jgi:predicted DNA-binding transcriptional regulator AlpA